MKLTTRSRIAALFLVLLTLVTTTVPAFAAGARVRCRVDSSRLRIQVDGQALLPGTYYAVVTNTVTKATVRTQAGKERTATALQPNIDLDFDNTAGPADLDSYVALTFATSGQVVRAVVKNKATGATVATASTTCSRR
ncbi:MAG: hypothetical protein ACOYNY_29525 [Caldilineaceae bacterium]